MQRLCFAVTIVAALITCGPANAQNADEKNLEYEKLKVLEPMVGTYHGSGTNQETGEVWEVRVTIAWSDSKKMLMSEASARGAGAEADLPTKEWETAQRREYYLWNSDEKHVEHIVVNPTRGVLQINKVTCEGDC